MSPLNTTNPVALQILMSETIFGMGFQDATIGNSIEAAVEEDKRDVEVSPQDQAIPYLGGNQKNIVFIVENVHHEYFSKEAELAFVKTLNALKLTLSDVSIVNYKYSERKFTFDQIANQFQPKACVLLGLNPKQLDIQNCAENILTTVNGIQFLYSFSFEEMLNDTGKKRIFWDAIKLMKTK